MIDQDERDYIEELDVELTAHLEADAERRAELGDLPPGTALPLRAFNDPAGAEWREHATRPATPVSEWHRAGAAATERSVRRRKEADRRRYGPVEVRELPAWIAAGVIVGLTVEAIVRIT